MSAPVNVEYILQRHPHSPAAERPVGFQSPRRRTYNEISDIVRLAYNRSPLTSRVRLASLLRVPVLDTS